jgi:hypothetical protein
MYKQDIFLVCVTRKAIAAEKILVYDIVTKNVVVMPVLQVGQQSKAGKLNIKCYV